MTEHAGTGEPPEALSHPDLRGDDAGRLFDALFDAHAWRLHRYLARRVGQHPADDLVAETFLVAYRRRHSYDPKRAQVGSWLFGIASNLLRRYLHQEIAEYLAIARAGLNTQEDHATRSTERLDAERRIRRLADGLAMLSQGDRDVLLLTAWAGLGSREVAEALGIPVGTVRSRLHRVRKQLRSEGGRT